MQDCYLDNNATTKVLPEVRQAVEEAMAVGFGNPSSSHAAGDRSRAFVLRSRDALAALIGAEPESIIFTSGGTEANNMILRSVPLGRNGTASIVTTAVEHSSILRTCEYLESQGVRVTYLPVDKAGLIDLSELEAAVVPGTCLVSVQWVNNETGVVQAVGEIAGICRTRSVPFHTDAAQAVGKLGIEVKRLPIDFLSLAAHKFHGPQGVGAVYARSRRLLRPLLFGGDQEAGLRAGTENLPGIVGMGKAAEMRRSRLERIQAMLRQLRDRFEERVFHLVPESFVNGAAARRVCNTSNLRFPGVDGQALVARLDLEGFRCSQGSACTSRRPEPSYVLRAMGLSEEDAYSSVRFSFSEENTVAEADGAAEAVARLCRELRAMSARIQRAV